MKNFKFEALNPGEASRRDQFETSSNVQNPNDLNFENLNFGFACPVKYVQGNLWFDVSRSVWEK